MASFQDRVIGAMKLQASTFEEVENDATATGQAAALVVAASVASGLGLIFWLGIGAVLRQIIVSLIGWGIGSTVIWYIGTKVMPDPATKADFQETFRVVAFAAAPGVFGIITVIPILGYVVLFLLWLWQLAAMVVAVRQVLDYNTTGKAIVVVIIGFIVNLIITFTLGAMALGGSMIRGSM